MQSLHVPTLILGHSMAKAGKTRRQSWWEGQLGVFRHPTPGTHAGLSLPCLSNQCWGLCKGPQKPCCPSAGLAELQIPGSVRTFCSILDPPTLSLPVKGAGRKDTRAHLLSPAAAPRSLLTAAGSSHEAFSARQKNILVTTWDVPQGLGSRPFSGQPVLRCVSHLSPAKPCSKP